MDSFFKFGQYMNSSFHHHLAYDFHSNTIGVQQQQWQQMQQQLQQQEQQIQQLQQQVDVLNASR